MQVNSKASHVEVPRLGSEVRFADGETAGRVRGTTSTGIIIARGRKGIRSLALPYSSISGIRNSVVTLASSRSEVLRRPRRGHVRNSEIPSKRQFVREIDGQLKLNNMVRTERVVRTTLLLTGKRFTVEKKKWLKQNMPEAVRSLWPTAEPSGVIESFDMRDYLLAIKKACRFRTMEEAFVAAREVFSALKRVMPSIGAQEMSRSMPRGLQDIWESAF